MFWPKIVLFRLKHHHFIYPIIIVIAFLVSCQFQDRGGELVFSKSVTYKLPYYPNYLHSGILPSKDTGDSQFYFGNLDESNKIYFFDFDGQIKDSLQLDLLVNDQINRAAFIHNKQFLCVSDEGNVLIFDSLGLLIKRFELDSVMKSFIHCNKYEFSYVKVRAWENETKVLLHPMWYASESYPYSDSIVNLALTNYKKYLEINLEHTKKTPLAYQLLIIGDKNQVTSSEIFKEYNNRIVDSNQFIFGYFEPSFEINLKNIVAANKFHDSLWLIKQNGEVFAKKVRYTKISNNDFQRYNTIVNLKDTNIKFDINTFLDSLEMRMLMNSYVEHVHYSKLLNRYFLVVKLPLDFAKGALPDLDFGFEAKNIVILDTNFNVISETILEKGRYRPLSYVAGNHLFICTHNPNKPGYKPNVYTFDVFTINQ